MEEGIIRGSRPMNMETYTERWKNVSWSWKLLNQIKAVLSLHFVLVYFPLKITKILLKRLKFNDQAKIGCLFTFFARRWM